jgi:hypothetical protein
MTRRITRIWPCIVVFAILGSPLISNADSAAARLKRVREIDWNRQRGVNYIPSYARNAQDIWRHYDARIVEQELTYARRIGFDAVRIWLHNEPFFENPDAMLRHLGHTLDTCRRLSLQAMLVLFDSCGTEPRPNAVPMATAEAYERFLNDSATGDYVRGFMKNWRGYALGAGQHATVPVGDGTTPWVIFWQWWFPNPGYSRLGRENWPLYARYVDGIVGRFASHPAVVAWDLMNEPTSLSEQRPNQRAPEVLARLDTWLSHWSAYIHEKHPQAILTIGNVYDIGLTERWADLVDLLSIHNYAEGERLKQRLAEVKALSAKLGKPISLTEMLGPAAPYVYFHDSSPLGDDQGLLRYYEANLPLFLESGLGFYVWGFITGQMFTPVTDFMSPSGFLRPAGLYLQRQLQAERRGK